MLTDKIKKRMFFCAGMRAPGDATKFQKKSDGTKARHIILMRIIRAILVGRKESIKVQKYDYQCQQDEYTGSDRVVQSLMALSLF